MSQQPPPDWPGEAGEPADQGAPQPTEQAASQPDATQASGTAQAPDATAAPQPGQAAPPQPAGPFAASPVPPFGPPPPQGPPPPPQGPPPKPRRLWLKITLGVVAGLVVICVGGFFLLTNLLRADVPQVGDCLTDAPDPNEMSVVDCGAAGAAWNVIGEHGTATRGQFNALGGEDTVCGAHQGTELALWVTETPAAFVNDSTEGSVICLAPVAAEPPATPAE